jgi:predicted Holliday junction resolvase-like endonuclease
MSGTLIALAVGFALGVAALVVARPHIVDRRARARFESWAAADSRRAVRRGVDDHRAGIKQQLGADLGDRVTALPFEAADVRFLGHPTHFVVFDGHTDVRDRRSDQLAEVVFVTVRPDAGSAGDDDCLADAELIEECVLAGRLRWSTLRPEAEAADARLGLPAGDAE